MSGRVLWDVQKSPMKHLFLGNWSQRRGHIEGPTWKVQWCYRNEKKDCVHWILIECQSFPLLCSDATEISNMAAGVPFNMAAVGDNKCIRQSSQNSVVISTVCLELSKEKYWLHSKPISEASKFDLLTNTELWVVFSRWPLLIGFKTRFIAIMSCSIQAYFWD